MRLYSFRLFPEDGRLYGCLRNLEGINLEKRGCKRGSDGRLRLESVQPYQADTIVPVMGELDRVNVTFLRTISGYVFCTPRCYTTRSWEIGVCNSYQLKYLCGGKSPTSFDFHLLMIMEIIQVYLHQMEIKQQSVGYFFVPDDLRKAIRLPRVHTPVPESSKKLWSLLSSMSQTNFDVGMSVTAQIAQLNLIRREYFNDLHLDTDLSKKSPHRVFLKLLGYLYGKVLGHLRSCDIIIRQYFGRCPFQVHVRSEILA